MVHLLDANVRCRTEFIVGVLEDDEVDFKFLQLIAHILDNYILFSVFDFQLVVLLL